MIKLAIEDHVEYTITLRGMDIERIVQLISDNAQSQGGFIHRSAIRSKHEPFHSIVQTDGDTEDMIHNETILRALQEAEVEEVSQESISSAEFQNDYLVQIGYSKPPTAENPRW